MALLSVGSSAGQTQHERLALDGASPAPLEWFDHGLSVEPAQDLEGVEQRGNIDLAADPRSAERPNVLLVVADDQSALDLRAYRPGSELDTPVIDALAQRGMTLDGAYHMGSWTGAVCTPSRHMIMSGRTVWHLPRNGIRGAGPNPLCPEDLAQHTLAAIFNAAGYDTMRTCKNGNSYGAANAQFTVRRDATKRQASAEGGSAWHADQVLDFLDKRAESADSDPFLIYFGFSHPHDPRWASVELCGKYGAHNTEVPEEPNPSAPALPVNWLPEHPFHHGHPGLRDEVKVQGVGTRRDPATIRNELGRQFACSESIDTQLGRVLTRLAAMGELENTIVIYTADHGMAIGRHGLQGKQNLYEHTWRVPFIAAGPGIESGKRAQGNVYLLDVLATLCELTGVEAPDSSEGTSFASVLQGEAKSTRDVLFGVYCGGTKPGMRSVRQGDWKLVKFDAMEGAVRETQLFNLAENPHEFLGPHHGPSVAQKTGVQPKANQRNLASDARFTGKLAEMEALLLSEMQRLDDPYRLWNQPSK